MRISSRQASLHFAFLLAFVFVVVALHVVANAHTAPPQSVSEKPILAATPPIGWYSCDSYSRTVNEDSIKSNARWMAKHLKSFGWEYIVVDEGWYHSNLGADGNDDHVRFERDASGRYVPVPARFPSAGKDRTFKPLGDYLHSLGLKFGIHI